jgi:hypothetical protein
MSGVARASQCVSARECIALTEEFPRVMNMLTKASQHDATGNEIHAPSHGRNAGLPVRRLAGVLAGRLGQRSTVYLVMVVKAQRQDDEPNAQSPIARAPKVRAGSRTRASGGSKCLRPTESGDFYLHADAWAKRRAD